MKEEEVIQSDGEVVTLHTNDWRLQYYGLYEVQFAMIKGETTVAQASNV